MSAGNPDRARRDRKAVDYTLTAFDKEMNNADKEMIARAKRGREEAADKALQSAASSAAADIKPKIKPDVKPDVKPEVSSSAPAGSSGNNAIALSDSDDEEQDKKIVTKKAKTTKSDDKKKPSSDKKPEDVILGHLVSGCVGIQHYRHNSGVRYNKEPLRLRREPHNPYDRNAVAVHELQSPAGNKVGHVPRDDAIAIAKVADELKTLMVGQVEGGAHQTYKFRLRISFFGPAQTQPRLAHILRYAGLDLVEPKPPKQKKQKQQASTKKQTKSGGAASSSSSALPADDDDDDEVEVMGEKTWAERDKELRAQAVVLE